MPRIKSMIRPGSHWDEVHFSNHVMMDALAKHLLGVAPYRMTDIGEVMEAYCQLSDTSEEGWIRVWSRLASRIEAEAVLKENDRCMVSAASLYMRAATYWRTALICYNNAGDPRVVQYSKKAADCYEKFLKLSDYPGTAINIPYEGTELPGHFYRSPAAGERAPLMILVPGRDTWAEDTRWMYDELLNRGIHCLCFDGPGQGAVLRVQRIPFRPDFENVITPVIDYALDNFSEIDPERIGIMGFSFGAFLSPRACAFEKRIKLCVTDTGNIDWGTHFADIFTKVMKLPSPLRPKMVYSLMDDYAWKHGVSREHVIEELRKYDNRDIADRIECDMLVLDGTAEINKGSAEIFYKALTNCRKEDKCFDRESPAQHHAQMGGSQAGAEYIADWIAANLSKIRKENSCLCRR